MNVVTRSYTRTFVFFVVSLKKKLKVFRYFVIEYHLISFLLLSLFASVCVWIETHQSQISNLDLLNPFKQRSVS